MVKLLIPVNYKGDIHEPGIVCFDSAYEKLLVKNGSATFDLSESVEVCKEDRSLEENDAIDEESKDTPEKELEEKPKSTKSTKKAKE